jgi:NAD+ diphosphatase
MECGTKLEERFLEGEGNVPYCPTCQQFRFPVFSTAVSMVVLNPTMDKILLIQQYGQPLNVLVAGYISKGENAEHASHREIMEEIGIEAKMLCYNKSEYYPRTNTILFNYTYVAASEDLNHTNREVDKAGWYSFGEARQVIKKNSLAENFLRYYLDKVENTGKKNPC